MQVLPLTTSQCTQESQGKARALKTAAGISIILFIVTANVTGSVKHDMAGHT